MGYDLGIAIKVICLCSFERLNHIFDVHVSILKYLEYFTHNIVSYKQINI